jgi:hypothetical protein
MNPCINTPNYTTTAVIPVTYNQNTASAVIPIDKTCYESDDGQFRVDQLVNNAAKYPPSPYPCIVVRVRTQNHTRVRQLDEDQVEIMPTYKEMEALVDACNNAALASGKGKLYEVLQRVPEKTREHKQRWKQWNEARIRQPWWGQNYGKK